jgi:ABC-type phosphate/phosphonate transport system substrate-binding protein
MIANLMMYAVPQLVGEHERLWQLLRHQLAQVGIESPKSLSQEEESLGVWLNPELVLSQTCGMPYRMSLHNKVNLVGTPDYGIEGCPPGYYRSPVVVRTDDTRNEILEFKDSVFAFNQTTSQSGYAAAYWHVNPKNFWFENKLQTGGHRASAQAVAVGKADIASLDAVTWRSIQRYESFSEKLRVLEWTQPTPGLPLITSLQHNPNDVFTAVTKALNALEEADRKLLGIKSLVKIPASVYLAVANPPLPECTDKQ